MGCLDRRPCRLRRRRLCQRYAVRCGKQLVHDDHQYPRNPNAITITFPKALGAPTVAIDDDVKTIINAGGSLVLGLVNGKLMGGFMLPARQPLTVARSPAAVTDTIATSMRAAAASLGMQQNP